MNYALRSIHFTFCKKKNRNHLHKKHWDDITKRRKKRHEQVKGVNIHLVGGKCNDEKNQSRHTKKSQISLMKATFLRRLIEIKLSYFIWLHKTLSEAYKMNLDHN